MSFYLNLYFFFISSIMSIYLYNSCSQIFKFVIITLDLSFVGHYLKSCFSCYIFNLVIWLIAYFQNLQNLESQLSIFLCFDPILTPNLLSFKMVFITLSINLSPYLLAVIPLLSQKVHLFLLRSLFQTLHLLRLILLGIYFILPQSVENSTSNPLNHGLF